MVCWPTRLHDAYLRVLRKKIKQQDEK